jgi:hypothetical protein
LWGIHQREAGHGADCPVRFVSEGIERWAQEYKPPPPWSSRFHCGTVYQEGAADLEVRDVKMERERRKKEKRDEKKKKTKDIEMKKL